MRKSQLKKNILIVRLSSTGDIVLSSPFAEILKRHNPNARIVWATQPESKEVLENNPYIDELYIWDRAHWETLWKQKKLIKLVKECFRVRSELKQKNFQFAYDLQGLFKSGLLTWLSGAEERTGIGSREGSYLFMHKPHIKPTEGYAVICPFTKKTQKHWQDNNWQQLVLRIRGRYQLKTLILGAKEEGTKGQQLARKCGAINLAGAISIQDAGRIINGASLVVGVDNALTHLSQASDTHPFCRFIWTKPPVFIYRQRKQQGNLFR